MMDRVVDPEEGLEVFDPALRSKNLEEYVGQARIKENLRVYIRAALARGEAMGPMGKIAKSPGQQL